MNQLSHRIGSLFVAACMAFALSLATAPRAAAETGVTNAVGAGQLFNGGVTNTIGVSGPFNALFITNGGVATNGVAYVGALVTAKSNTVLVAGSGSAWTNSGSLNVGPTGAWNQVTISNGGFVFSAGGTIGVRNGSNNVVLVSDGGMWTNASTLSVGSAQNASLNQLVVSNGGRVYVGAGTSVIGNGAGGSGNAVIVTGTNSLFSVSGLLTMGGNGGGHQLIITNGGTVRLGGNFTIASSAGVTNLLMVSGSNSLLNMAGNNLSLGAQAAGGNQMIISAGGVVINDNGTVGGVGAGSYSNSVLVTGAGSAWTNTGLAFSVGQGGSFNQMVVSNGAVVTCTAGAVGTGAGTNNQVIITGKGSAWKSLATIFVGTNAAGVGDTLLVTDGGLLEAANLSVGIISAITNSGGILQFIAAAPPITNLNKIVQDTGTIAFRGVTGVDVKANWTGSLTNVSFVGANTFRLNAASNAASGQDYTFAAGLGATNYTRLEMINGATLWQGGSLTVGTNGTMLVSNTASVVANAFTNRGDARVVNSTLTFSQSVVVASNGTFNLVNSTNTVGGGLLITANGAFGGAGFVNSSAAVTNFGTISPGNSPGTLTFSSNLVLGSSSILNIEIGGTNSTDFDRLIANGVLTLGGTLNVSLINGFSPSNNVSFDIISGGLLSGSFSTPNLPSASWSFSDTTGILSFTTIPEPGVVALVGLGGWLVLALRRRRGPRAHSSAASGDSRRL